MVAGSRSPLPRPISVPDSFRQQLPMTPPTDPSYTAQALRTESPITPALQTRLQQQARLVHAVLGLQTEAGELADPVKKHIYYGRPLDLVNLREEIGDCLWYLAIAADALGTTLEAEQTRNLAKLRARYPQVFTAEAARVRDLDREREVLEEDVADDPHTLRQQLAAAQAETVAMRKQLEEALKLIADSNTAGLQLWDKLQIANKAAAELIVERHAARAEIESLRKQLANAQQELSEQSMVANVETQQDAAAWQQELDAARAEIEALKGAMAADDKRLRDAEGRVWPERTLGCDAPDAMADEILHLRQQLDAANAAVSLQRAGIERLQAFVHFSRSILAGAFSYLDVLNLRAALESLDTGTMQPTPVAEPTICPECERLRGFVETVREWNLRYKFDVVRQALAELDTNSSATLTSSVVKESLTPTPVAEPLDAEGRQ